jgi:uncharacterized membrane protein YqaE (UPF0057 family)
MLSVGNRLVFIKKKRLEIMKLLYIALGILIPPLAVFLTTGVGSTLFINIGLTLLGYIPGSIHAVWVIAKQDQDLNESVYK